MHRHPTHRAHRYPRDWLRSLFAPHGHLIQGNDAQRERCGPWLHSHVGSIPPSGSTSFSSMTSRSAAIGSKAAPSNADNHSKAKLKQQKKGTIEGAARCTAAQASLILIFITRFADSDLHHSFHSTGCPLVQRRPECFLSGNGSHSSSCLLRQLQCHAQVSQCLLASLLTCGECCARGPRSRS